MASVTAIDFKAMCLELIDRVGERDVGSLSITKHGKVVVPARMDLTESTFEGETAAEAGLLNP